MTLRVHVAAPSSELERAEAFIAAVRAIGLHVTFDWTVNIRAARARGFAFDHEMPDAELRASIERDVRGCVDADFVVLLVSPDVRSQGRDHEHGIAIGAMKHTIAVGDLALPTARRGLGSFGVLVNEWVWGDPDALARLEAMARAA